MAHSPPRCNATATKNLEIKLADNTVDIKSLVSKNTAAIKDLEIRLVDKFTSQLREHGFAQRCMQHQH